MRIGDKVFVRIAHMYANGVIVGINDDTYTVKIGDHDDNSTYHEPWDIPKEYCTSVEALDKWSSEPTTR